MEMTYYDQRFIIYNKRLKKILMQLPDFCYDFFIGIENTTSILTRLNYANDLNIFFNFLKNEHPYFYNKKNIELNDIEKITSQDIERYLSWLSTYESINGKIIRNNEKGKARKLSSLRALFKYLFNKDLITSNQLLKVTMPKFHEKNIIRLEVDEVTNLLNEVDDCTNLTARQKKYCKQTHARDLALITLLLGTGIRVSECVGLNISDVNFNSNAFSITRKGGNKSILYMSDEVVESLRAYLDEREKIADAIDKNALFLSMQKKRISVRAVEDIVKKYAKASVPLKNISPHKLRSTYGTNLYHETKDIYIVADVLGHKDVNTTRKHYAAISDDIKRSVVDKVKLRK